MADALAAPAVANQSTKPQLSEAEILVLHNRVIEEKSVPTEPAMGRAQSPSLMATAQELSLDEILQKIQRDIATGNLLRVDPRPDDASRRFGETAL